MGSKKSKLIIFCLACLLVISISTPVLGASKLTKAQLEAKVAQLTKQVHSLTGQVKSLSDKVKAKDKEIAGLKSSISAKDKIVSSQKSQLGKKDKEIKSLKVQIDGQQTELEKASTTIDNQKDLIKQLQDELKKTEMKNAKVVYTDYDTKNMSDSGGQMKWYEFKTKYATLYFTEQSYTRYSYLVDISDDLLKDVASYYGFSNTSNISAFIAYNEPISMIRNGAGEYQSQTKTVMVYGSLAYPNSYGPIDESVPVIYAHEMAHAFDDASIRLAYSVSPGAKIRWLSEGMATYVSRDLIDYSKYEIPKEHMPPLNNDFKYRISEALKEGASMVGSLDLIPGDNHRHYGIYESLIHYVEKTYGHQKLLNFMQELKSKEMNPAMQSTFGVSEDQFMRDWKKYYNL
ncbi:hypothetical protein DRW41_10330 [Neobacillus piezotolerans]|uniref:Peptidase MA-like domain-containing protein n=1 Tax=Neobacillus piezotolerans TaxID=2259171 RepID=A0A3D8GRG2_9BACI|nr:hypothetical protein [Neobacillus piezotolerans]RDU37073.1 hypothetical protein DRW41_10330 [Neobacillus piezotolerans]